MSRCLSSCLLLPSTLDCFRRERRDESYEPGWSGKSTEFKTEAEQAAPCDGQKRAAHERQAFGLPGGFRSFAVLMPGIHERDDRDPEEVCATDATLRSA